MADETKTAPLTPEERKARKDAIAKAWKNAKRGERVDGAKKG